MQAVAPFTFAGDTRAHQFAHAVIIRREQAEPALYALAQLRRAALRAEQADSELQLTVCYAHIMRNFAHIHGVGRGAYKHGAAEVLENHRLFLRVPA